MHQCILVGIFVGSNQKLLNQNVHLQSTVHVWRMGADVDGIKENQVPGTTTGEVSLQLVVGQNSNAGSKDKGHIALIDHGSKHALSAMKLIPSMTEAGRGQNNFDCEVSSPVAVEIKLSMLQ